MNKEQTLKSRIVRYIVYFLGMILLCTIVSRTIYNYLLPVVSGSTITRGTVSVRQMTTGKIALDETQLKLEKVTLLSSMDGEIVELLKVEGDLVTEGEVIGHIKKRVDKKTRHDEAIAQEELSQTRNQITRERQQKQEKVQALQSKIQEQEGRLSSLEEDSKLVSLKEQIAAQEKTVESKQTLYEAGAISKQEQDVETDKLRELHRTLEDTRSEMKKTIEEGIEGYRNEINSLQQGILALDDQYRLNEKKSEAAEQEALEQSIVSPITGYIQTVDVYKGAYVQANTKLIEIVPEGLEFRLSFELNEEAANQVVVGQSVQFSLAQRPYKAYVIHKYYNQETGNIAIVCEMDKEILDKVNVDHGGSRTVSVEVSKTSEEYPIIVSNMALQKDYGQTWVYVIEEKQAMGGTIHILRKTPVNILEEGDFKTAISGNLESTMKLAVGDLSQLSDGQEVKLQ